MIDPQKETTRPREVNASFFSTLFLCLQTLCGNHPHKKQDMGQEVFKETGGGVELHSVSTRVLSEREKITVIRA